MVSSTLTYATMNDTEKQLDEAKALLMMVQLVLKQCIDMREPPVASSAWLPAKMIDEFLGNKSVYTYDEMKRPPRCSK